MFSSLGDDGSKYWTIEIDDDYYNYILLLINSVTAYLLINIGSFCAKQF